MRQPRQYIEEATRIVTMGDDMYFVKGHMAVQSVDEQGGLDHWKQCWGTDHVLRNGPTFYFCHLIIIADYEEVYRQ